MKYLFTCVIFCLSFSWIFASWEQPLSIEQDFHPECYQRVYEISWEDIEVWKIYQSYLNFSEWSFTAVQWDKYLPTRIFSKGISWYMTEFLNTQNLELPNNYQSFLRSNNDFFTLNVDKDFELDICFYEPWSPSCWSVLERWKHDYEIEIQSDNYIPVYNIKTGLIQNDEKYWKYLQDQEKYISVYDISELQNYDIRDIKITFEPKNGEMSDPEEIKIFSFYVRPKKREFLFRPTTNQNIEIYSDFKFDKQEERKCSFFTHNNWIISFSDSDKYDLYYGIDNNLFTKISLYKQGKLASQGDKFWLQCYEKKYTINKQDIKLWNIYEYSLSHEDRYNIVMQWDKIVETKLLDNLYFDNPDIDFRRIWNCFEESCVLPQWVPENYHEYDLTSQKSWLEFEVDQNFELDICFPPIWAIWCVWNLPKWEVSYNFDIQSDKLKPVYYLYDSQGNSIKTENVDDFEKYDITFIKLQFESKNWKPFEKQKVTVNTLDAKFKKYRFLMQAQNTDQDIEIYYKRLDTVNNKMIEEDDNLDQNCNYKQAYGFQSYINSQSQQYDPVNEKKENNQYQKIDVYYQNSDDNNTWNKILYIFISILLTWWILWFICYRRKNN